MSKKPIKSAEELEVYQLAYAVAMEIFEETKTFNREEKFSLTDQIRPQWVGLWNPTMRPAWFHRMRSAGYQLALVYQRVEFYVRAETRGQITED